MDGLPGLENCFKDEFTNSQTQRCWVHAKGNALRKSPARLRAAYSMLLDKVMYAKSEDDARRAFDRVKELMGKDAVRAVHCIEKDLDSLLSFYSFDKNLWTALRTTNSIENINRQFKRRTKGMDTLSEQTLETVLAFVAMKIELNWKLHRIDSAVFNKAKKEGNSVELVAEEMGLLN